MAKSREEKLAQQRERNRRWRAAHADEIREGARVRSQAYRERNPDKSNESTARWRRSNKDKMQARQNARYKEDPNFKLARLLRSRLGHAVRGDAKKGSAVDLLGCTIPELKAHLEAQFVEGMNWDTHGIWHIDHIKPLAKFDLSDPEQLAAACHYTNLQPLWARDNLMKGAA